MAAFVHTVVYEHFHDPVRAGLDVVSATAITTYWAGVLHNILSPTVATISLALSAAWYGFCLFEALEKRYKKK